MTTNQKEIHFRDRSVARIMSTDPGMNADQRIHRTFDVGIDFLYVFRQNISITHAEWLIFNFKFTFYPIIFTIVYSKAAGNSKVKLVLNVYTQTGQEVKVKPK